MYGTPTIHKRKFKLKFFLDKNAPCGYNTTYSHADLAHPVERHLAKVKVASSSLVIRSKTKAPIRVLFVLESG